MAIAPIPGRSGQYQADWTRLMDWGPALVISMTQQVEFDRQGAGAFGADLARAGVDWLHCPVRDFGVPDGLDWPRVRDLALVRLGNSERVLVHCLGGCGRSGMMVLRLMIAAGETPDTALLRLRQMRPCAVETAAQLAWAQAGR